MVTKSDPRADAIRRRRHGKVLRDAVKEHGIAEVARRFVLSTPMADTPNEECEDCIALQRGTSRRARFVGYDPKTHSAYVREILP